MEIKNGIASVLRACLKLILILVGLFILNLAGMELYDYFKIAPVEASVRISFTPVVEALDKHLKATGRYPDALETLVPAYIKELPQCPVIPSKLILSNKTTYGTGKNGSRFWLGCHIGALVYPQYAQYHSDMGRWIRND